MVKDMIDHAPVVMARSSGVCGSWRFLEFLAVFVIAASVIGLLALRLGMFLAPQIWIAAFLVTYAYARLTKSSPVGQAQDAPAWHLLLVVGVALMLRLPPFAYLLGGQDQGIYMNMAGEIIRTGSLMPVDFVLEAISSDRIRELYLQANYMPETYLPGVYRTEHGLQFQFYHLFPVWLAMFGSILGAESAVYALTFLSLVSLLFVQRLAHSISGSAKAGLTAGLLLALNPLHTFFSRFPVTELVALAFSAMAFTYLLACLDKSRGLDRTRYLVMSLLALGMVFMTRISGFLYLPLILLILVIGQVAGQRETRYLKLMYWGIAAIGIYAASVLYGLQWSASYAKDIYQLSFELLLGDRWPVWLVLGIALCTAALLGIGVASWNPRIAQGFERLLAKLSNLLPFLVIAFTAIGIWKAYQLGYTSFYASHPKIGALADGGIRSTIAVSLVASWAYLSPFLALAFLVASFGRDLTPQLKVLLFFTVCFYAHMALLQWFLPYQPYYGRYLVSELIPYIIVFVVCFWFALRRGVLRRFMGGMLFLCGAYSLAISVQQMGKSEHDGLPVQIERLAGYFEDGDLIVIDRELDRPSVSELKTPLIYIYGLSVVTAGVGDLAVDGFARRIAGGYQEMYFLTRNPENIPESFSEIDSVGYIERIFCRGNSLPVSLCTRHDVRLRLFKLVSKREPGASMLEYRADHGAVETVVGVKQNRTLRASGRAGFIMFGPYAPLPAGQYSLVIEGATTKPFRADVVAARGSQVLVRQDVPAGIASGEGVLVRLDFDVTEAISDFEARLLVADDSDMVVNGYRIEYR